MLSLLLILGFLFTAHTTFLSSTAAVFSADPFDVWLLAHQEFLSFSGQTQQIVLLALPDACVITHKFLVFFSGFEMVSSRTRLSQQRSAA